MLKKVWFHIPYTAKKYFRDFKKHEAYTTHTNQKEQAYTFFENEPQYLAFLDKAKTRNIPYYEFRSEYTFSPKDYENAKFYAIVVNVEITPFLRIESRRCCPICHSSFLEKSTIVENETVLRKVVNKRIFSTFCCQDTGSDGYFISRKGLEALNALNLGTDSIHALTTVSGKQIHDIYHFTPPVGIGDCLTVTNIYKDRCCTTCGQYANYLLKGPIYLDETTWNGLDIFTTNECFGSKSPLSTAMLIGTKRAYSIIKGWEEVTCYPCFG